MRTPRRARGSEFCRRAASACRVIALLLVVLAVSWPAHAGLPQSRIAQWRELLTSDEAGARNMAALALLDLPDDQAADTIRNALRAPQRPASRLSILNAIALRADDRFLAEIIPLLGSEELRVADAAWAALVAQKSPQAAEALIKALEDPLESAPVRHRLARVAAERREPKAIPALIELLGSAEGPLRAAALESLEKLTMQSHGLDREAWRRWWQGSRDQSRETMLEEVIRSQEATIQRLSDLLAEQWIKSLSSQDLVKDSRPLTQALTSGFAPIQIHAAKKLAQMKGPASVAALAPCLASKDRQVRQAAAQALGEIGDAAAVGPLVSLLDDAEAKVAAAAASALGRLKAADAAPALLRVLKTAPAELAAAAARALGDVGARQAVAPLSEALLDEKLEGAVREEAAAALGKLNDPAALPALVSSLGDSDDRIRWAAADGLGRLGSPESVAPLCKTLTSDTDPRVREVAALSLGNIRSKEAVADLLSGMGDPEQRVADQSLAALLAIVGSDVDDCENLGADLVRQGGHVKAVRFCRAAIDKISKDDPGEDTMPILRVLGFALAGANQWADARKPLEEALQANRGDRALYPKLVECYVQLGERERATTFGVVTLRKFPDLAATVSSILAPALESLFQEGRVDPVVKFVDAFTPETLAALPGERRVQLTLLKERCGKIDDIVAREADALAAAAPDDQAAQAQATARFLALGEKAIPYLIQTCLANSDLRVQDAGIDALARLTGHPFDIEKDFTPEQRQNSIRAWLVWWQTKTSGGPVPASVSSSSRPGPARRN